MQTITRTYLIPRSMLQDISFRAIMADRSLNHKKCNGHKKGTVQLVGWSSEVTKLGVKVKLRYRTGMSQWRKIVDLDGKVYKFKTRKLCDLTKIFKTLSRWRNDGISRL